MIELRNVHKRFGSVEVLKGITASVEKSEVVCIIGPSGSGKSTILRCINGLESYDAGDILVEGARVESHAASIVAIRHRFQWYSRDSICFRTGQPSRTSSKDLST